MPDIVPNQHFLSRTNPTFRIWMVRRHWCFDGGVVFLEEFFSFLAHRHQSLRFSHWHLNSGYAATQAPPPSCPPASNNKSVSIKSLVASHSTIAAGCSQC